MAGMATVSTPQELPLGVVGGGWSAADLELLPDDGRRYEIIDGVLVVSPSPAVPHQRMSHRLAVTLDRVCRAGMEVFEAPLDWTVSESTVFQADLMVVRGSDATGQKLAGTPLLVVEIASPSTAQTDRTRKFEAYARAGVGQYWIVDPGNRGNSGETGRGPSIEVYDLGESGGYELQARGVGDEPVTVTGPVSVTVSPADLIV